MVPANVELDLMEYKGRGIIEAHPKRSQERHALGSHPSKAPKKQSKGKKKLQVACQVVEVCPPNCKGERTMVMEDLQLTL